MYRIEDIQFFANLSQEYNKLLHDKLLIKNYAKDSILFYEGDSSRYLYVLLEGSVKLYKSTPKGNQIYIHTLHAPSLIGEYACFEQKPYPATCEFLSDGVIGLLPFEIVYKLLGSSEFALNIIRSLTGKVMILSTLVHNETVLSSEAKVADLIIRNQELFKRLKNSEIAAMLNLTPETLSRILAKFKKEKLIELKKHNLNILNLDSLKDIVDTNRIKECTNCILNLKKDV